MIDALVQGKLTKTPERRTARNGNDYALASVSIAQGDEPSILASVITFRSEAIAALTALEKGDSIALAGSATIGVWTPASGATRASLSITAEAVLSVYAARKRRAAATSDDRPAQVPAPSPNAIAPPGRPRAPARGTSEVAGAIAEMVGDDPFGR